jgi:ferredoxin-NADP reductase
MRNAKLLHARLLTPSVRELTFDPGPSFSFTPGQWVSFRIPDDHSLPINRAYSIASGSRPDGLFQVAVTHVESGPGSGFLHRLPIGQSIDISEAQGFFLLEEPQRPILMIATGTGISPFRSMLEGFAASGKSLPRTTVLLGVRSEQDILFAKEFDALRANTRLQFLTTLSRPSDSWSGLKGYVQDHIPQLVHNLGADCDVYVCGLNKMVKDVRSVLKTQLGFDRERIHTERYD